MHLASIIVKSNSSSLSTTIVEYVYSEAHLHNSHEIDLILFFIFNLFLVTQNITFCTNKNDEEAR